MNDLMDEVIKPDADETPEVPEGQTREAPKTKDDHVTISRAELESLKREREEARQSERYWASMARGSREEPAGEPEDDNDSTVAGGAPRDGIDGDTADKLVEEFSTKGVEALKKRGFITAADAHKLAVNVSRELIARERQKITSDSELITEFPDLRNQDSELFKETAKRYQKAVAMDPGAKKTPAALYLAADAAREYIKAKQPPKRQYRDEDEEDRRHRADSQDGRSRGRSEDEDGDMLGSEAKQIMKAMGITEEEFRASQKQLGIRRRR